MRVLIWLSAAVAALAAAVAGWALVVGAPVLGELWFRVDPYSLNLTQAIVQRYIHPRLWDDVLLPVLFQPTVLVAAVVAILFAGFAWLLRPRAQ